MANLKPFVSGFWLKLRNREYTPLGLLVIIVLILHFSTILQPQDLVFDEQYYVPSAGYIIQGEGTDRTEHPPLAQLIITAGILVFGDNPFGWRIFTVLFSVAGLVFFYMIGRQLGLNRKYAFLATFLLSFENLSFIMGSVAMLDVFSLTFMLGSFWLYLKGRYASSGLMVALATLCKLTGILALPVILVHWLLTRPSFASPLRGEEKGEGDFPSSLRAPLLPKQSQFYKRSLEGIYPIGLFLATSLASFFLLMPLLEFAIWHKWLNPFLQVKTMLTINAGSTFAAYPSEMLSRPWDWLIRPEILTFWIDPHYIAMISPPIWVLIIPAAAYSIFILLKQKFWVLPHFLLPFWSPPVAAEATKNRPLTCHSGGVLPETPQDSEESGGVDHYYSTRLTTSGDIALFALIWFTFTYLIWISVSLISDRMSYIYYIYPAIGSVCLAISMAVAELNKLINRQSNSILKKWLDIIIPLYLLLCLGAFVILSPIPYWWKLPLCVAAYFLMRYYIESEESPEAVNSELFVTPAKASCPLRTAVYPPPQADVPQGDSACPIRTGHRKNH
jgi:dolichyl-phosphate-mannose-protein mannosyltransferase